MGSHSSALAGNYCAFISGEGHLLHLVRDRSSMYHIRTTSFKKKKKNMLHCLKLLVGMALCKDKPRVEDLMTIYP